MMSSRSRSLVFVFVLAGAISSCGGAFAAAWRFDGQAAGLWVDGGFNGLAVGCSGAALSLRFFGFPTRLSSGTTYSVVVTIDGTARRFRADAGPRRGAAGTVLSTAISGEAAREFVAALRRGRRAEVATPAGLYELPLSGSAKALDALGESAGCLG